MLDERFGKDLDGNHPFELLVPHGVRRQSASISLPDEPIDSTESVDSVEEADNGEPEVHVSEAAKAARREAQRIAAAEEQAVRTWRDYKWLWIVLGLLVLLIIIYWGIYQFSDAMEDGLHNTMRPEHRELITISITPDQGERL